jgi:hypothetical protein
MCEFHSQRRGNLKSHAVLAVCFAISSQTGKDSHSLRWKVAENDVRCYEEGERWHITWTLWNTNFTQVQTTNSIASVRERTIPIERQSLVNEVSTNFWGSRVSRCQRNGSPRPYFRLLDRRRYYFFQVAPQLYSRGWVDSVPDPLLLRKSGGAGYRTRTSGSVARYSDHYKNGIVVTVHN